MAYTRKTEGRTFEITMDYTGEITGHVNGWLVQEIAKDRDNNRITAGMACFGRRTFTEAMDEIDAMLDRERETLTRYPFFAKDRAPLVSDLHDH